MSWDHPASRGANSWAHVEPDAAHHEGSTATFFRSFFELPSEILPAGQEVITSAALGLSQQGEDKETTTKTVEIEGEKDPFEASDRLNKPDEMLIEGFPKDKEERCRATPVLPVEVELGADLVRLDGKDMCYPALDHRIPLLFTRINIIGSVGYVFDPGGDMSSRFSLCFTSSWCELFVVTWYPP